MVKRIVVRVPGGLGNQCFAYFCGLFLAEKFRAKLVIDFNSVDGKHTENRYDLGSFHLTNEGLQKFLPKNKYLELIKKIRHSAQYQLGIRSNFKFIDYLTVDDKNGRYPLFEQTVVRANRLSRFRTFYVEGYFHTLSFFDEIKSMDKYLMLKNPSREFQAKYQLIKDTEPIGMQLRLGDFQNIPTYGVLTYKYYLDCLNSIPGDLTKRWIWVFSNDVSAAKIALEPLSLSYPNLCFIDDRDANGNFLDPAEALKLLSSMQIIISGNSTLSLIAGLISKDAEMVFYPSPSYKSGKNILDAYPKAWTSIESSFE